ncbi:MAG: hypothetical protein EZS28_010677, partial [Streblomastix strix]
YKAKIRELKFEDDKKYYKDEIAWVSRNYSEYPTQPLISFFPLLVTKTTSNKRLPITAKLQLPLPDTFVFLPKEEIHWWLITSNDGYLEKIESFTNKDLMMAVGRPKGCENELTAVMKVKARSGLSNELTILNTEDLKNIIISSPAGDYILQRYVQSKGAHPWFTRMIYNQGKSTIGFNIQSKNLFSDDTEGDFRKRFTVVMDVPLSATVFKAAPIGIAEPIDYTEGIVRFVQRQHGLKIEQMVCDFIKDAYDQWWFLQVKAFRLTPECLATYKKATGGQIPDKIKGNFPELGLAEGIKKALISKANKVKQVDPEQCLPAPIPSKEIEKQKPNLHLFRMLLCAYEIFNLPIGEYQLAYQLMGSTIVYPLTAFKPRDDIYLENSEKVESIAVMNKFRVHYFFADPECFESFLHKEQQAIRIVCLRGRHKHVGGHAPLPTQYDKDSNRPSTAGVGNGVFMTGGFSPQGRPSSALGRQRPQTSYDSSFFTCEPLPDDWVVLLPQNKATQMRPMKFFLKEGYSLLQKEMKGEEQDEDIEEEIEEEEQRLKNDWEKEYQEKADGGGQKKSQSQVIKEKEKQPKIAWAEEQIQSDDEEEGRSDRLSKRKKEEKDNEDEFFFNDDINKPLSVFKEQYERIEREKKLRHKRQGFFKQKKSLLQSMQSKKKLELDEDGNLIFPDENDEDESEYEEEQDLSSTERKERKEERMKEKRRQQAILDKKDAEEEEKQIRFDSFNSEEEGQKAIKTLNITIISFDKYQADATEGNQDPFIVAKVISGKKEQQEGESEGSSSRSVENEEQDQEAQLPLPVQTKRQSETSNHQFSDILHLQIVPRDESSQFEVKEVIIELWDFNLQTEGQDEKIGEIRIPIFHVRIAKNQSVHKFTGVGRLLGQKNVAEVKIELNYDLIPPKAEPIPVLSSSSSSSSILNTNLTSKAQLIALNKDATSGVGISFSPGADSPSQQKSSSEAKDDSKRSNTGQ